MSTQTVLGESRRVSRKRDRSAMYNLREHALDWRLINPGRWLRRLQIASFLLTNFPTTGPKPLHRKPQVCVKEGVSKYHRFFTWINLEWAQKFPNHRDDPFRPTLVCKCPKIYNSNQSWGGRMTSVVQQIPQPKETTKTCSTINLRDEAE